MSKRSFFCPPILYPIGNVFLDKFQPVEFNPKLLECGQDIIIPQQVKAGDSSGDAEIDNQTQMLLGQISADGQKIVAVLPQDLAREAFATGNKDTFVQEEMVPVIGQDAQVTKVPQDLRS